MCDYSKAGLLRVGPVTSTSSPTTQRSTKPATLPQKTQAAQAVQAAQPVKPTVPGGRYEEDPCVICHEDMNASSDIVTLECGHRYHSPVRFISAGNNFCYLAGHVSFQIFSLVGHITNLIGH